MTEKVWEHGVRGGGNDSRIGQRRGSAEAEAATEGTEGTEAIIRTCCCSHAVRIL
jgi:hypothetical protein